jgi:uncharacterized membrane protein
MERPQSVTMFERLYAIVIGIGVVNAAFRWSSIKMAVGAQTETAMLSSWFLPVTFLFGIAINILLWFFIARRGSNVARWIYVVLLAFGLIGVVMSLVRGTMFIDPVGGAISGVSTTLSVICAWLLFRPDANRWFKPGAVSVDLKDTFS